MSLHIDTPDTIDESGGADPDHPLNRQADADARLGGHDAEVERTMLEQLHEAAERVGVTKRTVYEVQAQARDDLWQPLGVYPASSARDAMRRATDGHNPEPGTVLRAIPVRNITELTLDVETTTRLRLS